MLKDAQKAFPSPILADMGLVFLSFFFQNLRERGRGLGSKEREYSSVISLPRCLPQLISWGQHQETQSGSATIGGGRLII